MAIRSSWKGSLRVGLVMVPVKMFNAEASGTKISFHNLHGTCQSRTGNKKWCPKCNREIVTGEIVRGYEFAKGQHVLVTDAELEACESAASQSMDVTTIVSEPLDPAFIDTTAYLLPDGPAAWGPFETLRAALGTRLAIASVVIRDHATLVALQVALHGFTVYLLRAREQVRDLSTLDVPTPGVVPAKHELQLARQLLDAYEGSFDYEATRDLYAERLRLVLDAKANGGPLPESVVSPQSAAAASLADALASSLKLVQPPTKPRKPMAKVRVTTPAQSRRAAAAR